jgi:hypothetical protein
LVMFGMKPSNSVRKSCALGSNADELVGTC